MEKMEPVEVIKSSVPISPWGKVNHSKEESFADIMSEQLANDLRLKEESYDVTDEPEIDLIAHTDDDAYDSDAEIARAFQLQFDKEYDEMLEKTENKYNGGSKVSVSYTKYRRAPDDFESDSEPEDLIAHTVDDACDSDAAIARALQLQFDKEYDEILKKTENKYNGGSKVSISYTKYRRAPDDFESDSEPEEEVDDRHRVWDSFEASEKAFAQIPRCGYRRLGANEKNPNNDGQELDSAGNSSNKTAMVTKHDMTTAGRRNACRFMSAFPPEVCTGDGGGFDMRLSNKVFNGLRAHQQAESKRRLRFSDKSERATCEQCLDPPTRLQLLKLLDGGTLESISGILGTGKEAVVVHAMGGNGITPAKSNNGWGSKNLVIPEECAIKIFKTTLNRFKAREKYIRDDYRFRDRFSKQNPRKVIHLWAEKEMHNLLRMQKAGIPCPEVVCLKKHILVMSFIGDGERHRAAPKLKDACLKPEQYLMAYNQIVDAMVRLYRDAELVHCDLSEYNVLWQSKQQRCVIIDVAQAVESSSHPQALPFLLRDCENVSSFFRKKGVKEAKSAEELFTLITDHTVDEESGRTMVEQIQNYIKREDHLNNSNTDSFEYCWEQSMKQSAEENTHLQSRNEKPENDGEEMLNQ